MDTELESIIRFTACLETYIVGEQLQQIKACRNHRSVLNQTVEDGSQFALAPYLPSAKGTVVRRNPPPMGTGYGMLNLLGKSEPIKLNHWIWCCKYVRQSFFVSQPVG